jgi:hypothetical protein
MEENLPVKRRIGEIYGRKSSGEIFTLSSTANLVKEDVKWRSVC